MKKIIKTILIVFLATQSFFSFGQKSVTDGILVYDIAIHSAGKDPKMSDALDGGTITVYLKGSQSKTDMVTSLGKESTIHDAVSGATVILKEYNSQKLMITLTKDNWEQKNKMYEGLNFTVTNDTATIAGYACKKATATLPNGKSFSVYFTPAITVANKDYNSTFKNLPGLAIQYDYGLGTITLSKINTETIPASTFDIPKSGFRVMTYEENQEMKKKGN